MGTPELTGQVSYGAGLGGTGQCITPHAHCQSNRRAHNRPSARLECDAGSLGYGSKTAMCEGRHDGHSQVMQRRIGGVHQS